MTQRAKNLMSSLWEDRNSNKIKSEEELVSSVLRKSVDYIKMYKAQNDKIVLDKNDIFDFAKEIESNLS